MPVNGAAPSRGHTEGYPMRYRGRLRRTIAALGLLLAVASPGVVRAVDHDPVLLVHGWRGGAGDWAVMVQRFVNEGIGREVVTIQLPGQDNVANAEAILDLVASRGWLRFDLVGVSMGGLSARYFARNLGGTATVDSYVSLGTPQYGIWAACLLSQSRGGQMCPTSSFLRSLNNGDDTPGSVRYMTLTSPSDTTVPSSSTRLDGGACFVSVPGVVHTAYEENETVFARVVSAIDGGCPGTFQ